MAKKKRGAKPGSFATGNPNASDEEARSAAWRRWVDRYARIKEFVESPIELNLSNALATIWEETIGGPLTLYGPGSPPPRTIGEIPEGMAIIHQQPLGPFRIDFWVAIIMGGEIVNHVLVECDGHDFHERTKEQAARDRSRDRQLALMTRSRLLRFTGSEIHRDCFACAEEILKHLGVLNPGNADENL